MFEGISEKKLLLSLKDKVIALSPKEKAFVLCAYIEMKTYEGIGGAFEQCFENPFSFWNEAADARKQYLLAAKKSKKAAENVDKLIEIGTFSPDEIVCELLAAHFGLIYSLKSIPDIIDIYDALFIDYEERIPIVKSIYKDNVWNNKDFSSYLSSLFIHNCIILDPVYPPFVMFLLKDNKEFIQKINAVQTLLKEEGHSSKFLIITAINYVTSNMRKLDPECRFDRLTDKHEIIAALVAVMDDRGSIPKTTTIYMRNRAYDAITTLDILVTLMNEYRQNKDQNFTESPLCSVVKKYFNEISEFMPKG